MYNVEQTSDYNENKRQLMDLKMQNKMQKFESLQR
jgi:ribosomal protein L29